MRRRHFIALVGGAAAMRPLASAAQQASGKIPRIGLLIRDVATTRHLQEALINGLRDLGYIDGRNILIDYRDAAGQADRYTELVSELLTLNVDVIVVTNTPAAFAAKRTTSTVPIVLAWVADPVGSGLVAGLSRPGGNITGLSFLAPDLVAKRLELLAEAVPGISRIAVLWHPGDYGDRTENEMLKAAQVAATTLGMEFEVFTADGPEDFERAFFEIKARRADAITVQSTNVFFTARKRLVELAAQNRLPAVYLAREFVVDGGLMSYAPSVPDLVRRAAGYVDKILKGAKPADLPVEQPTKFELVINLRAAQALGLTLPQSLLARADEVIE